MKTITIKGIEYNIVSSKEVEYTKPLQKSMTEVKEELLLLKRPAGKKTYFTICYTGLQNGKPFTQLQRLVSMPASHF